MTQKSNLTRRQFLRTTAGGVAVASATGWTATVATEPRSANEKLNIACVGTANRAAADISQLAGESIVALCDPDSNYLQRALGKYPGARGYADYREMLDKEAGKIDAVMIATPDHHHAPATIRALRAGLHVYCEKPLTHTIHESRVIAQEAEKQKVATQMGTQIHAGENYRRVVEMIQSGVIGDVTDVHVWVAKHWGGGDRPAAGQQPPAHLDWDLWLGPAPERPFAAGRYHPSQWRRWWDFGTGTLGDMGCHYMDLPFWALKLKYPITCEAEGPEVHAETAPIGLVVRYEFPARGELSPCTFTWYDSNRIPKEVAGQRVPGNGVMFIGRAGMLYADYKNYRLFPQQEFVGYQPPEPTIPRSIGHHAEWIKACKDGSPTTCNFEYASALSEAVLLGTVAFRLGKKLQWDGANMKATNCPEADPYLRKTYREGWEVA